MGAAENAGIGLIIQPTIQPSGNPLAILQPFRTAPWVVVDRVTAKLRGFLEARFQAPHLADARWHIRVPPAPVTIVRRLEISYDEYRGQVVEFLPEGVRADHELDMVWDEMRLSAATLIEAAISLRGDQ